MLAARRRRATDWVPRAVVEEVRMRKSRHRNPQARYVRTPDVHPSARIGTGVGVGPRVVLNAGVYVGDHTYINSGTGVYSGQLGKYCSVGHNVQIGPEDHPLVFVSTSPMLYDDHPPFNFHASHEDYSAPPQIGNDVWIGSGATILQGSVVSDGAVIAAGAVVRDHVEPYGIAVGVPARVIRKRFDPPTVDWLLQTRWWDMSIAELQEHRGLFEAGPKWRNSALGPLAGDI